MVPESLDNQKWSNKFKREIGKRTACFKFKDTHTHTQIKNCGRTLVRIERPAAAVESASTESLPRSQRDRQIGRIWKFLENSWDRKFKLQKITENCLPVRHLIIIEWSEIHFWIPGKKRPNKAAEHFPSERFKTEKREREILKCCHLQHTRAHTKMGKQRRKSEKREERIGVRSGRQNYIFFPFSPLTVLPDPTMCRRSPWVAHSIGMPASRCACIQCLECTSDGQAGAQVRARRRLCGLGVQAQDQLSSVGLGRRSAGSFSVAPVLSIISYQIVFDSQFSLAWHTIEHRLHDKMPLPTCFGFRFSLPAHPVVPVHYLS